MDSEKQIESISFSVDAGLVNRLGKELVGKPETALSELVKNAYDADATVVDVIFKNADKIGGVIIIEDDGIGMDLNQLEKGFMRISSTDKLHNPKSYKFARNKAGRKGIGRFATQRLGQILTIVTQTVNSNRAIKVTINWNDFKVDTDLSLVKNKLEYVDKTKSEGTTLIIENAWESWSESTVARVYRYVSDLFQPNYISKKAIELKVANKVDSTFKVSFVKVEDGQRKVIADPDTMLFNKALATIEGFIDENHDGYCQVLSNSLDVSKDIIPILHEKKYSKEEPPSSKYKNLSNIHFKAYYFIYQRDQYYTGITKQELANIQKLANEQGGIKLYSNGFRVLPYGESNDDWLLMDKRNFYDSGVNIPFGNRNLFGFVEIIDQKGEFFEETASREGLIENDAFVELITFLNKSFEAAKKTLRYGVEAKKNKIKEERKNYESVEIESIQKTIEKIFALEKSVNDILDFNNNSIGNVELKSSTLRIIREIKADFQSLLDELGMLRVLASLGLTIGEFTHEVIQFSPSMMGDLSVLDNQNLNAEGIRSLENLRRTIRLFTAYTAYFNATVSANINRELRPQQLTKVVLHFKNIIDSDIQKQNLLFQTETYGYELFTIPMHSSEWSSILFNLYTNAKKAIRRQGVSGKIKVILGRVELGGKVYLEFLDNGDGIPEENRFKVFEPFFTTSSPLGFEATDEEKLGGTGLGLKIVKDIVQTYGGTVEVGTPDPDYSTCIRIELPEATKSDKERYAS